MKTAIPVPVEVETIATEVVDAALKVHRTLGPGLLESVYEACLVYELRKRGLEVKTQVILPVVYDGVELEAGLRLDIIVNDAVILELKAVDTVNPVFEAQLLTYLKLTGLRLGFLINFNLPLIKDGIRRMIR